MVLVPMHSFARSWRLMLCGLTASWSLFSTMVHAQMLGAGYQTVVKTEYQYSDYFSYTYPDPIVFEYPDVPYFQPSPYLASFPEHRFLTKVTQSFGFDTALGLRYQWSQLDQNTRQDIYYARLTHDLNDQFSVMGTYQYMALQSSPSPENSYGGHMLEIGGKFNFAGAVHLESSYGYYSHGYVAPNTRHGGAHSLIVNYRQALGANTAFQLKYNLFYVDVTTTKPEHQKFQANTATCWLSQYLTTQTAVHLSNRFYWNSDQTRSFSPALEIVQYLRWNIILHLAYRYYQNHPKDELFRTRIHGDSFTTHGISLMLDYNFSANTKILLKYRYYTSDQQVQMNTYLIGWEQIL